MSRGDQAPIGPPIVTASSGLIGDRVQCALASRFEAIQLRAANGDIEHYVARDNHGDVVELRVLSARRTSDAWSRDLFRLEAEAASRLAHVNIIGSGHAEELNGVLFSVTEHKPAVRTLRELVDSNGWLDMKSAAEIADQLAGALGYAHQAGVLHLRLQPESILVEPDGWVTLVEFGIAAGDQADRLRPPRVPYASPEQTMRATVDHRSDLYSLGAVLYEMLTDRTPFDSTDEQYVRQRQVAYQAAPPHLISTDVPESVSAVVMSLLERDPAKRFSSATALQAALAEAMNF